MVTIEEVSYHVPLLWAIHANVATAQSGGLIMPVPAAQSAEKPTMFMHIPTSSVSLHGTDERDN